MIPLQNRIEEQFEFHQTDNWVWVTLHPHKPQRQAQYSQLVLRNNGLREYWSLLGSFLALCFMAAESLLLWHGGTGAVLVMLQYPRGLHFSQGCSGTAPAPGTPPWPHLVSSSLPPSWRGVGARDALEHPCPMPEGGIELNTSRCFSGFGMPGLAGFLSCLEENGKSESLLQKIRQMNY